MRYLFSFLLLFTGIASIAQSKGPNVTVSGTVLEKDSNFPLEYATVSFTDSNGQIVTGGITDMDGKDKIDGPAGTYSIKYEFISYKTHILNNQRLTKNVNLPVVYLDLDAAGLDEVVVRAETTEVQIRLDKKIYNIGKDLTAGGATVSDALNNVPSVTVDVDGTIALRGSDNVKIL